VLRNGVGARRSVLHPVASCHVPNMIHS